MQARIPWRFTFPSSHIRLMFASANSSPVTMLNMYVPIKEADDGMKPESCVVNGTAKMPAPTVVPAVSENSPGCFGNTAHSLQTPLTSHQSNIQTISSTFKSRSCPIFKASTILHICRCPKTWSRHAAQHAPAISVVAPKTDPLSCFIARSRFENKRCCWESLGRMSSSVLV